MAWVKVHVLLLMVFAASAFSHESDDIVEAFLEKALNENFTNWAKSNGYDPFPPNPNSFDIHFSDDRAGHDIHATFVNFTAFDLTEELSGLAFAQLDKSELHVSYVLPGMKIGSQYKANGTYANTTIQGDGTWTMLIEGYGFFQVLIDYKNFTIISDGTNDYIDLSDADLYGEFRLNGVEGFFEIFTFINGMDAGENNGRVKDIILEEFISQTEQLKCTRANPAIKWLDVFVRDLLLYTPIGSMGLDANDLRKPSPNLKAPGKANRIGEEKCMDAKRFKSNQLKKL